MQLSPELVQQTLAQLEQHQNNLHQQLANTNQVVLALRQQVGIHPGFHPTQMHPQAFQRPEGFMPRAQPMSAQRYEAMPSQQWLNGMSKHSTQNLEDTDSARLFYVLSALSRVLEYSHDVPQYVERYIMGLLNDPKLIPSTCKSDVCTNAIKLYDTAMAVVDASVKDAPDNRQDALNELRREVQLLPGAFSPEITEAIEKFNAITEVNVYDDSNYLALAERIFVWLCGTYVAEVHRRIPSAVPANDCHAGITTKLAALIKKCESITHGDIHRLDKLVSFISGLYPSAKVPEIDSPLEQYVDLHKALLVVRA